jgi:hypothetical protein
VNDKELFVLKNRQVIDVKVNTPMAKIAITNGYHYLEPINLALNYNQPIGFKIESYLDNVRIGYLIFITLFLFGISWMMHYPVLQIIANLPLLGALAYLIFFKKNILLVRPLQYQPQSCRG